MSRREDLLIRRSRQVVQDRMLPSVCWADIPQLPTRDKRCPAAWQQYWQQSRPNGTDPRPFGWLAVWGPGCEPASRPGRPAEPSRRPGKRTRRRESQDRRPGRARKHGRNMSHRNLISRQECALLILDLYPDLGGCDVRVSS